MLPICGIPIIFRSLSNLEATGFQECGVVISQDDKVTIPFLRRPLVKDENDADSGNTKADPLSGSYKVTANKPNLVLESDTCMKITVLPLHEDCSGSIEALRKVEEASVVPKSSNIVLIPGDLVVFYNTVRRNLCDTHRQGYQASPTHGSCESSTGQMPTACTVLLTDVGEHDEHGAPLKESAKVSSEAR